MVWKNEELLLLGKVLHRQRPINGFRGILQRRRMFLFISIVVLAVVATSLGRGGESGTGQSIAQSSIEMRDLEFRGNHCGSLNNAYD